MLAGGVGAAKFLRGLIRVADPSALTIIVNTADDERFFGLAVSPDLDTITYTLAGAANPRTGWGLAGDTFGCLDALQRFYDAAWFHLGDRDLATHMYRTQRLAAGAPLSQVADEIAAKFGVRARILPMSNDRVQTILDTPRGPLSLQRWLVERRARPRVLGVRYRGATRAAAAPGVVRAIRSADAVIIAPSNPFLSIGPILAVPAIGRAIRQRRGPVAAVSPVVGGRAVTGPLARLLRRARLPVSAVGIAACYRPFVRTLLVDRRDRGQVAALDRAGCRAVLADTVFTTPATASRAARRLLAALEMS